jgi:fructokinase
LDVRLEFLAGSTIIRCTTMNFKVLGVGEVLWDLLPEGKQLGGAPANFVYHARAMGAEASLISRVGDDPLGREIIERLFALGIPTCDVSLDGAHPTGTVEVEIGADGQPRYVIQTGVAWDYLLPDAADSAAEAHAICFGTLAQRNEVSRASIHALLYATKPEALRVLDVNLRQDFYSPAILLASLKHANVLKLNDAELPVLAVVLGLRAEQPRERIAELAERFELRLVAYTRGEAGSVLWRENEWSEREATQVEVKDTIGAGDSFTAAVTMGMLLGWTLPEIHGAADAVASFVCSQPGGTPPWPEPLRARFANTGRNP